MNILFLILAIVGGIGFFVSLVTSIVQAIASFPSIKKEHRRGLYIVIIICFIVAVFFGSVTYVTTQPSNTTSFSTPTPTTTILSSSSTSTLPLTPSPSMTPPAVSGPYGGTLVLKDTLRDDGGQHYFQSNLGPNNDSCKLTKQGYQITATNSFFNCDGGDSFANFAFQVNANVGTGSSAGFIFRHNSGAAAYLISIDQSGCYTFNNGPNTLQEASTNGHTLYQLTLVAKNNTFSFIVNGKEVSQFKDSSYISGTIGLMVTGDCKGSTTNTQAIYTDAIVWKL